MAHLVERLRDAKRTRHTRRRARLATDLVFAHKLAVGVCAHSRAGCYELLVGRLAAGSMCSNRGTCPIRNHRIGIVCIGRGSNHNAGHRGNTWMFLFHAKQWWRWWQRRGGCRRRSRENSISQRDMSRRYPKDCKQNETENAHTQARVVSVSDYIAFNLFLGTSPDFWLTNFFTI